MLEIRLAARPSQVPDATNIAGPLGHADGPAGVEQIERVGTLQAIFIGRQHKRGRNNPLALSFIHVKEVQQHFDVGLFEVVGRVLHFGLVMHIAIGDRIIPFQIVDVVHPLKIHGNSFKSIGEFNGDGIEFNTGCLLKVGELGYFHAVKPHFPSKAGRPESGRLPVVLHKPDIVGQRIDPQGLKAFQVYLLDVDRRRLQDDLILVIVLETIGVLPVTAIRWTTRRLHVCHTPGFRAEDPQKGSRMKSPGPDLNVIRLLQDAAPPGPEVFQSQNEFLKSHHNAPLVRYAFFAARYVLRPTITVTHSSDRWTASDLW